MSYEAELKLARRAALAAGDYLAGLTQKEVESLEGRDIKLKADKASEGIILEALSPSACPVISEETAGDESQITSGARWIIDPIDGTFNYYKGLTDLCCVSVALWEGGKPILGVVYKFNAGQFIQGAVGRGVDVNGQSYSPSDVNRLKDACLATGFPVKSDFSFEALGENIKYIQAFKKIRMLGSAALMSAYVGIGRLDVYFEKDIFLWDIAAGAAIVAAAGGSLSYVPKAGPKCDFHCFANERLKESFEKL